MSEFDNRPADPYAAPGEQPYQPVQQPYGQQPPQYAAPPQYGQPYGQPPGYGQPQYGQPYAYPGQQPPPAAPKKRNWLVAAIAAVVAAAVVITLVVVLANRDDHKSEEKTANRTVSLPASFGAYRQVSTANTSAVRSQIASQLSALGAGPQAADNAKVGAYATGGSIPQIVFLGFRVDDVPKLKSQLEDIGTADALKQFTDGVSKGVSGQGGQPSGGAKSYDPGKLGGAMRCQVASLSQNSLSMCTWGDRSYFALTLVIGQTEPSRAATTTRQLREAAEH